MHHLEKGGDRSCAPVCRKDPPTLILRAIARLHVRRDAVGLFTRLDSDTIAALAEILGSVSVGDPAAPVRIRRSTFAQRLRISEPSVTRRLAALAGAGWIERDQELSRMRGFQVATARLTPQAIEALGLAETMPKAVPRGTAQDRGSGVIRPSGDQQSFQRQPQGVLEDSPIQDSKPQLLQGSQMQGSTNSADPEARVPEPLRWLLARLSAWGIFGLMGHATRAGTRLEDVAEVARKHLDGARNPFSYLRRLISSGRDWSAARIQAEAATEQRERKEAASAKAEGTSCEQQAWLRANEGKRFVSTKGLYRYKVIGGALIKEDIVLRGEWRILDLTGFLGAWRAGQVILDAGDVDTSARAHAGAAPRAATGISRPVAAGAVGAGRGTDLQRPDAPLTHRVSSGARNDVAGPHADLSAAANACQTGGILPALLRGLQPVFEAGGSIHARAAQASAS